MNGYDANDKYCLARMNTDAEFVYSYNKSYSPTIPKHEECTDLDRCLYYATLEGRNITDIRNNNGNILMNVMIRDIWCDRIDQSKFKETLQHMYVDRNDGVVKYNKNIGPFKKDFPVRPNDILVGRMYDAPYVEGKTDVSASQPFGSHYNYGLQIFHILLTMKRDGVAKPKRVKVNFTKLLNSDRG